MINVIALYEIAMADVKIEMDTELIPVPDIFRGVLLPGKHIIVMRTDSRLVTILVQRSHIVG